MTDIDPRPRLSGLVLRSLLVLILAERRRPMDLQELTRGIHRAGFAVGGRPGKEIADALRWEVERGRVIRYARGVYGPGVVAKVTKHRMRARVAERRNRTNTPPRSGSQAVAATRNQTSTPTWRGQMVDRPQLRPTAAGSRG